MVPSYEDKPVVPVDDVEVVTIAKLDACRQHVGVHVLNPSHKLTEVTRTAWFGYAVIHYTGYLFLGQQLAVTAGQHMNVNALNH